MSPFYWTTWTSLVLSRFMFFFCEFMFYVLTRLRVVSELFHLSVFIGACVMVLLVHTLLFCWTMCLVLIGLRGNFLLDHASRCCTPTCHFFNLVTWLDEFLSRLGILLVHVLCPDSCTCHALIRPHVKFLFDHVPCAGSTTCTTIIVFEN